MLGFSSKAFSAISTAPAGFFGILYSEAVFLFTSEQAGPRRVLATIDRFMGLRP
jgi:hypothetical protein